MKKNLIQYLFSTIFLSIVLIFNSCTIPTVATTKVKPPETEVKQVIQNFYADTSSAEGSHTGTGTSSDPYICASGSLKVVQTGSGVPYSNALTFINFSSGIYLINGSLTISYAANNNTTKVGTLSLSGGDITDVVINLLDTYNSGTISFTTTGTMTINGYSWDAQNSIYYWDLTTSSSTTTWTSQVAA